MSWGSRTRRQATTIHAVSVPSGFAESSFTYLATEAWFDDEALDSSSADSAKSDGGDLLLAVNNDGTARFALDIIDWSPAAGGVTGGAKALIRFRDPDEIFVASSVVDTDVYWGYKDAAASQPAAGDPYGQYATYDSNWKGYFPLQSDFADRTSVQTTLTNTGSIVAGGSIGKFGNATAFNGSQNLSGTAPVTAEPGCLVAWAKATSEPTTRNLIAGLGNAGNYQEWVIGEAVGPSSFAANADGGPDSFTNFSNVNGSAIVWHHVVGTFANDATQVYRNGTAGTLNTTATTSPTHTTLRIGARPRASTTAYIGDIQDVQVFNNILSANWVSAEYSQTNDPAAFASAGVPESIGGGPGSDVSNEVVVTTKAAGYGSLSAAASIVGVGFTSNIGAGSLSAITSLVGEGFVTRQSVGVLSATASLVGIGASSEGGTGVLSAITSIAGVGYVIQKGTGALSAIASIVGVGLSEVQMLHLHFTTLSSDINGNAVILGQTPGMTFSVSGYIHNHDVIEHTITTATIINKVNCNPMVNPSINGTPVLPGGLQGVTIEGEVPNGMYSFDLVVTYDVGEETLHFIGAEEVGGGGGVGLDLLTADILIDDNVNPYKVIWYEVGTVNVLMSKRLYDRSGGPIRSPLQHIGSMVADDLYADQSTQELKLATADIAIDRTVDPYEMVWYEQGTAVELMRKTLSGRNAAMSSILQQLKSAVQ